MTTDNPIEVVQSSAKVGMSKSQIQGYRDQSQNGLKDFTDQEILDVLVEDILGRYFNEEYFDLDGLYQSLS